MTSALRFGPDPDLLVEIDGSEIGKASNPIVGAEDWDDLIRFYEDFLTKRGRDIFQRLLTTVPGADLTRRKELEALFRTAYSRAGRATSVSMDRIYDFDPGDIRVAEWAEAQAGNLVRDISTEQDGLLKRTIAQGVRDGLTQEQIQRRLNSFLGLDRQQTQSLQNFYNVQRQQGVPNNVVEQKAQAMSERMLKVRAERIARTEVARALESAKLAYFKEAADAGVIKRGDVWRIWRTHPDERTCAYCAPLDGKMARIGGVWTSSELGSVAHPPLHVNCRCWTDIEGPGVYLGPGGELVAKHSSLLREVDALLAKHGTHDQKSHGNWARGGGAGSGGDGRRKKLREEFSGESRTSESPRTSAMVAHQRVTEGLRNIFGPDAPESMTPAQMQEAVRFMLDAEYDTSGKPLKEFIGSMQGTLSMSDVKPDGTVVKVGTDSLSQRIKDGKLTSEAKKMHRDLVKQMEDEQGGSFKAEKQVVVMAGLPGAGKTYLLENFVGQLFKQQGYDLDDGYLTLNADEVKRHLIDGGHVKAEGLTGMEMSSHAHEESSYIFKAWRDHHISRGTNMLLDITAMNGPKTQALIDRLMSEGYTVHVVHADATPAETQASAIMRIHNKGSRGGRPVDFAGIAAMVDSDPLNDPIDVHYPAYREQANGLTYHYKTSPFVSSVRMEAYGASGIPPKEQP